MSKHQYDSLNQPNPYPVESSSVVRDGIPALVADIKNVANTEEVPKYLDWYVKASKEFQLCWYKELFETLMLKGEPKDYLEATDYVSEAQMKVHGNKALMLQGEPKGCLDYARQARIKVHVNKILMLKGKPKRCLGATDYARQARINARGNMGCNYDLKGFMEFYKLPLDMPMLFDPLYERRMDVWDFKLSTLPVLGNQVTDGACFGVSVEVKLNDFYNLPVTIASAVIERRRALLRGDHARARQMLSQINCHTEEYEVVNVCDREILTRKYQIRLRGIRICKTEPLAAAAAKEELRKMVAGKHLEIKVFCSDDPMFFYGDVYHHGRLLQDMLINKRREASPYWESV